MSFIDVQNKIETSVFGYTDSKFKGYLINVEKGRVINERTHRISHSINHWEYGTNPIRVMVNIGKRKDISRGSFATPLSKMIWEHINGPISKKYVIEHLDGNIENNSIYNLTLVKAIDVDKQLPVINIPEKLKKKIIKEQSFECANYPESNIMNLEHYECPLWREINRGGYVIDERNGSGLFRCCGYRFIKNESDKYLAICKLCFSVYSKNVAD